MQIEIDCNPSKKDAETLSQGIIQFNDERVPDLEPVDHEKKFHVFAKDEDGEVVGGIRATCFWNTLHVELLWISEETRGKSLGRKLIESAEAYARQNGCSNVLVETTSWQARPFYERNGYQNIATLNDRPKGHASYYLTKKLTET
ncbi:GNAT family N-acetyltransferase [Parasphingopyxis algicola]|uniref:GNAT family N-acetyltransferase n=1 Tax=Parasphingopyxis algicola TaxID=2026624 RepID=UPI0015A1E801|nr:GNAT family N-acetyltransferase [Parasphingopyxis algicola]QLC26151.1 GNAT family N-acetyltransferase [Parasphingopyxis algicola]